MLSELFNAIKAVGLETIFNFNFYAK